MVRWFLLCSLSAIWLSTLCEVTELKQKRVDAERLQEALTVALKNRQYSKDLMTEQLKRDPSSHGDVIAKLLSDTFEAIFIFRYPEAHKKILCLQEQIESLEHI